MEGADKCVSFKKDNLDLPCWDRPTEEKLFEVSVIKAAGATVQKIQIPIILYILLFVIVALSFIQLMVMTGRLRI